MANHDVVVKHEIVREELEPVSVSKQLGLLNLDVHQADCHLVETEEEDFLLAGD